jgi:hypothetical protein
MREEVQQQTRTDKGAWRSSQEHRRVFMVCPVAQEHVLKLWKTLTLYSKKKKKKTDCI